MLSTQISHLLGVRLLGFPQSPISPVMIALLLGVAGRNLAGVPSWFLPGITFSSRRMLRLGIILLGLRMSFLEAAGLLRFGAPAVLVGVATGLIVPSLFNRRLRQPARLVTLIGVGTSICGVSAIAALAPSIRASDEETAYAVATITLFGLSATVLYPLLAAVLFGGNSLATGVFLGVAIHDTSQVTGAAFLYQDYFSDSLVVDAATVTKLLRNTLMLIVIPLASLWHNRLAQAELRHGERPGAKLPLPWFVLGFVMLTAVRTAGDWGLASQSGNAFAILSPTAWRQIVHSGQTLSSFLIVAALGAVGLSTPFSVFRGMGIKPLIIGLATAILVGIAAFFVIQVGLVS